MTEQQKTDARVWVAGVVGIVASLPWIEWDQIRPAALASVMIMVGCFLGFFLAVVIAEASNGRK